MMSANYQPRGLNRGPRGRGGGAARGGRRRQNQKQSGSGDPADGENGSGDPNRQPRDPHRGAGSGQTGGRGRGLGGRRGRGRTNANQHGSGNPGDGENGSGGPNRQPRDAHRGAGSGQTGGRGRGRGGIRGRGRTNPNQHRSGNPGDGENGSGGPSRQPRDAHRGAGSGQTGGRGRGLDGRRGRGRTNPNQHRSGDTAEGEYGSGGPNRQPRDAHRGAGGGRGRGGIRGRGRTNTNQHRSGDPADGENGSGDPNRQPRDAHRGGGRERGRDDIRGRGRTNPNQHRSGNPGDGENGSGGPNRQPKDDAHRRGGTGQTGGRGRSGTRGRGQTNPNQHGFSGNAADGGDRTVPNQSREACGPPNPRRIRRLGCKGLEALLEEDPSELVFKFLSTQSGFIELLNEMDIQRDLMALIVNLLCRVCESSASSSQSLSTLLCKVYQESQFITRHLTQYITNMMSQTGHSPTVAEQVQNVTTILVAMLQRLPSSVNHVNVVVILLQDAVPALEGRGVLFNLEIKNTLQRLVEYQEELKRETVEQKSKPQRRKHQVGSTGPPPDDFRQIPIFPTIGDLNIDVKPYLRKNIVDGGYTDVNHYLDVQFRLLREDFVAPLRSGIKEYQDMKRAPQGKRNQCPKDIRIYDGVQIEYPMCSWNGIMYRVHFDHTKFQRRQWQSSKRLIFGSLVCLSSDDFQTMLFATVADSKPADLEQGFVDLRFENRDILKEIKDEVFVMAETSAYFEAYRHVLEGLQQIKRHTLPLQRYIIDVAIRIDAPEYLRQNPAVRYDLSPLVAESTLSDNIKEDDEQDDEGGLVRRMKGLGVTSRNRHSATQASSVRVMGSHWPSETKLKLNSCQMGALKMALTKELAVIQGPPGTGKTYISLKIVQALLHNSRVWSNENYNVDEEKGKTRPLLVVCFTNHALDQFLEGILKFQNRGIVRIGGRSASEALKSYNLNVLKREVRKRRQVPRHIREEIRNILRSMAKYRQPMEVAQKRIAMATHAVLNEDNLRPYMIKSQYDSLVDFCPPPQNLREVSAPKMLTWLGLTGNFHVAIDESDQFDTEEGNSLESSEEMEIDEEADVFEEQRMLDDQDLADRDIHIKGYDVRQEFALDADAMETGEKEALGNKYEWQQATKRKSRIKQIIKRKLQSKERLTEFQARRITNVWTVPAMTRWQLYRYWMSKYRKRQAEILFEKQETGQETYERLVGQLKEIRTEEDLAILNGSKVIGMTTTGAAKYRSLLQRIKPRIIVVEEAAEVLESHIITTLSRDCQQLILIGDHQQLRPNPTVYELAKDFKLDISLFERMVDNGLPCQKLIQQHRMRPEISGIMKLKHFYPNLLDHSKVKLFENIKGVGTNVFFLDHDKLEARADDTKSHSNKHEAEFLVSLCRYFMQQGYEPGQITILTTYSAQLLNFKHLMQKDLFKGVRVSAVDGYQGEENDIILLSLVRSNREGSIGFLKVANRVCVALSRAKKGLFCIGNFGLLASKGDLWKDIVALMKNNGNFGTRLKLVCHNHPDTATEVSLPNDFTKVPEGGCDKPCEARLQCGHACSMTCHPRDPQHLEYRCLKPCTKVVSGCPSKHPCTKSCYQDCVEKCTKPMDKQLPCGHRAMVPCHQDTQLAICHHPCERRLTRCGHPCKNECGEKCTTKCQEIVLRSDLPCGHKTTMMKCSADPEDCTYPCGMELLCGHKCIGTCGKCQRGRLHMQCRQKCDRTLVCGHACKEPCTKSCPPCQKRCQNRCIHRKCQNKCGYPCTPCMKPCEWQCLHHQCNNPCSKPCNREPCTEPCMKKLKKCGHPCIGLCGETCPNKCRICDKEEVTEILFGSEDEPNARFVQLEDCGHVIEVEALDSWMETADQAVTGEKIDIQLKTCPKCKTLIRNNLRYGNVIKKMLTDIEGVKKRMFGDEAEIKSRSSRLISKVRRTEYLNKLSSQAVLHLNNLVSGFPTLEQVTLAENLLNLLSMIATIRKKAADEITHEDHLASRNSIHQQLKGFDVLLIKPRMRMIDQELEDVSRELKRLSLMTQMAIIECRAKEQKRQDELPVRANLIRVKRMLTNGLPLTDDKSQEVQTLLRCLDMRVGGLSIVLMINASTSSKQWV
ncbi:NFX1-type zinc finger-containing protein 1-like [Amphiura filiformis]|uniref:NFX1-type zinc finger-containing protein 1-like n=1 Tax=Amphiura filiformis TaxID=82378 RepID=UPI003B21BB2C